MKRSLFAPALCASVLALSAARAEEKEKPRPDEFVYEGRPAAEWALQLKAGHPKAAHALSRLGKDAVKPLIELLKDPDEKTSATASNVLSQLRLDKETLNSFLALLKDEHFEVRRTAARLLAKNASQDVVGGALKHLLNDRDRAVAEAAEEALALAEIDPLLDEARGSLKQGDPKRAMQIADRILALNPGEKRALEVKIRAQEFAEKARGDEEKWAAHMDNEAKMVSKKKTIDTLLRQAREMIEKGELEKPMRIVAEAQKMFPDDPNVTDLRRQLEKNMKERAMRKAGEGDPFDRVDKEGGEKPMKKKKGVGEDAGEF